MLLFLIPLIVATYLYFFYRNVKRYPPGPTPLPLLGNLLWLNVEFPHKAIDVISKKYGPVFTLWLPLPTVIITGLEEMKEALIKKGENFSGRPTNPTDSFFMTVPNGGIIFAQGEEWKEQRNFALKVLRDFGVGSSLSEDMIHRSLHELFAYLESCDLTAIDANWPVHLTVGNVVHQLLFGSFVRHDDTQMRFYQDLIEDAMKKVRSEPCVPLVQANPWMIHAPIVGWRGYGEMRSVALELIRYVESEIKRHQAELNLDEEPSTYVAAYLQEMERRHEVGTPEGYFNMDNLVNTATDLWLAGMETAATSIRWGFLFLVLHPQVQEKLYEEIQREVGERRITMSHRLGMPYAQAVIHEIQRLSNVVTFNVFRRTYTDDTIAGTTILPQICSVMSDVEMYERPDEFLPERFLEDDGITINKTALDRLVAFSMGKRQCAGEALARAELFIVLLSVVQKYKMSPADGFPVPSMKPVFGILQTPQNSMWKLERRQ